MTIDSSSAEWWSNWSDWLKVAGFILGGLVVVVAVVGWAFSLKAGKLKDEASKLEKAALEKYKQESRQSIAEADLKSAEANKVAATANERAALLEKEAANARLELEKLKEKQIPWILSDAEQRTYIECLKKAPKCKLQIGCVMSNPQSQSLATQLIKASKESSIDTLDGVLIIFPGNKPQVGVAILLHDPIAEKSTADIFVEAFQSLKIPTQVIYEPTISRIGLAKDRIGIIVGAKP